MLLIGLDFGSTTSSAMLVAAQVLRNCVTGRREFGEVARLYASQPVLTPFAEGRLDEGRLAAQLDTWLAESAAIPETVQGGGAIVTGLAARADNASAIARLVKSRWGDALVATADDPCLESWLAFMGNTLGLSRAQPRADFINLDIGGGTTNLAWGRGGQVQRTGCWFLGARHIHFLPGTYRIVKVSTFAEQWLAGLGVAYRIGEELTPGGLKTVLDFHIAALKGMISGETSGQTGALLRPLEQVRFEPPRGDAVLTFSGGVGELVYRHAAGEALPGTTAYGDLGIDLAERIARSPRLSRHLRSHVPPQAGRATVAGLTIHNTELSGNTVYLPRPETLPWCDLPLLGRLTWDFGDDLTDTAGFDQRLHPLLQLAARHAGGSCLALDCGRDDYQSIKQLGARLASGLLATGFPADRPLVLLVSANIGKALGQYATGWGQLPHHVAVLDEIPDRHASFVTLGRVAEQSVPLSFYGMLSGAHNDCERD